MATRSAREILAQRAAKPLAAPAGAFPIVRGIVADLRAAGLDPTLRYASEAGLEIGKRGPEGVSPSLPPPKLKKRRA